MDAERFDKTRVSLALRPYERMIEMIRSTALLALTALTIAWAPTPSVAQSGVPGVSSGTVTNEDCGRACREERRRNESGTIAQNPRQNIPPGYYRDDRPDRPGRPDRPRPPRYEDPGYYRPDPRPPRPHHPRPPIYIDPGYRPPIYESRDRLSCREARQIVRSEGFREVRAVDCEGRTYQFEARRKGRYYLVVVSARSGDILDVSRL